MDRQLWAAGGLIIDPKAVLPANEPFPMRTRLEFEGTCNRCGLCCTTERDGQRLVCEYLRAEVPILPLGHPQASRCAIYDRRLPDSHAIPVRMLDQTGQARTVALCFKDTWQEDHTIAERGLGRGCSLTLKSTEGQLVKFEPAKER